jgi:hypothetical protein
MSSIIKVNTFQDTNGNALFNSDGSGNVTLSASGMKMTPSFWVIKNASQSIAGDTAVQLTYETEILDSDGAFASSTFTPQKAGYYLIYAQARFNSNDDADQWKMMFYKNGSELAIGSTVTRTQQTAQLTSLVHLNGSSDNIKFYVYHNLAGTTINVQNQSTYTYAQGFKIIGA